MRSDWPNEPGRLFVSPSSMRSHALCERRWAYVKVDGRIGIPNEDMEFGKLVHERIEAWELRGDGFGDDDAGRVAAQAQKHLARGRVLAVEGMARIDLDDEGLPGVTACGYFDAIARSQLGNARVLDWKVGSLKSSISPDAAKRHALDFQVALYGEWACRARGIGKVQVSFVHLGAEKMPDGSRRPIGTAEVTSTHVRGGPGWRALLERAEAIARSARRLKAAQEGEATASSCGAMGRPCEHADVCPVGGAYLAVHGWLAQACGRKAAA